MSCKLVVADDTDDFITKLSILPFVDVFICYHCFQKMITRNELIRIMCHGARYGFLSCEPYILISLKKKQNKAG